MKTSLKIIATGAWLLLFANNINAQWLNNTPTTYYNGPTSVMVGVGTGTAFTPTDRLHIKDGNILLDYTSTVSGSINFGALPGASSTGMRMLFNNTASSTWNGGYIDVRAGYSTTGLKIRVDNTSGSTERMRITAEGKVGINCTNPTQKLQIDHDDATGGIVLNRVNGGTNSKSEIKFNKNGVQKYAIGNDFNNDGTNIFFIWNQMSSSAPFMINSVGKVSIGGAPAPTSASIYKLYVEGGIVTRDVKVTATAFPDYVFSKDYSRLSLSDLDTYIQKNHHLPGIPSATEVEANDGYELGQLQLKMLEKIEEQALYIIELNKLFQAMKLELVSLKAAKN